MVWCQVIKGNDKPCANYARKGLTCCYSHRKLEVVEPVQVKQDLKELETFEINPWDDDGIWNQLIEAAYEGPGAFVSGLEWVACCSDVFHKGPAKFVFHKSLRGEHMKHIIDNRGCFYKTGFSNTGKFEVYADVE